MTKSTRPTSLAEALANYLEQSPSLSKRLEQAGVIEAWPSLVGPQVAQVTIADSVTADGVLRVRVASAPWANELSLMTPAILARVNAGRKGRIREIRWLAT